MRILIPMAGRGERFKTAGYETSKPALLTYDLRTGKKFPMVVCATLDLPGVAPGGRNVIYVERDFHRTDGTEKAIKEHFPEAVFLTVDHLTEGQACTCLTAEKLIDCEEELLIAGCDNGMEIDFRQFEEQKKHADMLVFTFRHNPAVEENPDAYGWIITNSGGCDIEKISIKQAVSDTPMEDHAVVATFWFRKGSIFMEAARKMIAMNDRVNGEFYVDETIKHVLRMGYKAQVFEVKKYIGWGTPTDYETYQKTFEYWDGFCRRERRMSDALLSR